MGHSDEYVLDPSIVTDFALIRAWKGDSHGNMVFRTSARNSNPLAAMAGRITICEVEHLYDPGELDPDEVHLPGIYMQRVVELTHRQVHDKRIEKRTTRPKPKPAGAGSEDLESAD